MHSQDHLKMHSSILKTLHDSVFSFILIILLFPLFALVSLAILFFDGMPILFLQERIGKNAHPFKLIKFRTMTVQPDTSSDEFSPDQNHRITKLGSILRKYKIDELPQFINVLKGDIAIVGPRPEVRTWVEKFPKEFAKIHTIKPGITDYASIKYRNEELILREADDPFKEYNDRILPSKMAINIEYIDNHSFFLDLRIIVKTIFSLFWISEK